MMSVFLYPSKSAITPEGTSKIIVVSKNADMMIANCLRGTWFAM